MVTSRLMRPSGNHAKACPQPLAAAQKYFSCAQFGLNAHTGHGHGAVEFNRDQAVMFAMMSDGPR